MKVTLKKTKEYFKNLWYIFINKYTETSHEKLVRETVLEIIKNPSTKIILTNNTNSYILEGYLNNKEEEINIVMSSPYIYIQKQSAFIELYCRPEFSYRLSEAMCNYIHNTVVDVKTTIDMSKEKLLKEIKKTIK